jgi:capsule polysaccharide export protein KpsE/RkpR
MIAQRCRGFTVACIVAASFAAGCSSSSSTSSAPATTTTGTAKASASASPTSTAAVCKSAQNLKNSVANLKVSNIRANGLSAVQDEITNIQQQLHTLKTDAHGEFAPQIDALSSALSTLSTNLSAARANFNGGTLAALASSAASVVSAGQNLVTTVTNTC